MQGLVVRVGAATAVLPSAALNKSRTYSLFSLPWGESRELRAAIHECPPHPSLLYFGDSLDSGWQCICIVSDNYVFAPQCTAVMGNKQKHNLSTFRCDSASKGLFLQGATNGIKQGPQS